MRDHPEHGVALVGASWGSNLTLNLTRKKWKRVWDGMLKDKRIWSARGSWGPDQELLHNYVWKVFEGRKNTLQHDAYTCAFFKGSVAWPTQRLVEPNNFVASVVKENVTLSVKCPTYCRPKNRPQWEYC